MNKSINIKTILFFLFLAIILLWVISYMGCDIRSQPSDIRDNVWNYSKKTVKIINSGIEDFQKLNPVVSNGMVTFNEIGKESIIINSKTQKKLYRLNDDYVKLLKINNNELTESEMKLLSKTLELVKIYYKLDILVKQYDIICLQIKSGIKFEEDNDKYLKKKREEIIFSLDEMNRHSVIFKELFNVRFDTSINKIKNRISDLK
ncbi:hypothetical protein [Clostridium polynesiense]|uniref:hypothetical protein n=1 Tax=Clostridium polynesiense TaxID=1325933 RepID=UPI00058EF5F8|nr:hypothetical protein [Clostridium polynesiense]